MQHLCGGRLDLMLGRGISGPVYSWFGRDPDDSRRLATENYRLLRRLWDEDTVDWSGEFRTPLRGFTAVPRPLAGHTAVRLARVGVQRGDSGTGCGPR